MSWYIGVDIYTKKKNENWKPAMISNYWLMAKNLCDSRGALSSEIESAKLSDTDRKCLEDVERLNNIIEDELVATIHKESWKSIIEEPGFRFHTSAPEGGGLAQFYIDFDDNEAAKIAEGYDVDPKEYIEASADKRESDYISIYRKKITPRGYNGDFYDAKSFYGYASKVFDHLEELLAKKTEYKNLQKSLDYMKLSEEEKENVNSEYECLDEDIEEYRCKYEAAISMANILDFYQKDYDDEVVAYIYGD